MSVWARFKKLFDPIDLTKGSIAKGIGLFLIPIVLSLIFQQIYTLTDTIIVGQNLGEAEVAGVNSSAPVVWIVMQFAIGAASGYSVVTAERRGAKDEEGARKSYLTQIILTAITSLLLAAIALPCIDPLLSWLGIKGGTGNAAMQAEYEAAKSYIAVLYIGTFATAFYNMIFGVLRSYGDSFTPFLFLVISAVLNVGLDLLFIVVFRWGVAGSAWATVISQAFSAFGAMGYAALRYKNLRIHKSDWKISWRFVIRHLKNGLPMAFQFSLLEIGIIIMQAAMVSFDRDPSGAMVSAMPVQLGYGAAGKVFNLMMAPMSGLGSAMLAFMGQNYGARNVERMRKGFRTSLYFGLVIWIVTAAIGLLLMINGAYQRIFLSADKINEDTLRYGNYYLFTVIPLLGFLILLFIGRNSMQGIEKPLWPFLAGIGELVARSVICLFLPQIVNGGAINCNASDWAYISVCLADPLAWIVACFFLVPPLIKSIAKWKKEETSESKDEEVTRP